MQLAWDRLSRRDFLSSSALASVTLVIAGSGLVTACSDASKNSITIGIAPHGKELLRRFARHLYPHDDVADEVYSELIDRLVAGGDADSPFNQALREGVASLDAARETQWLSLSPAEQIAVMKEQETQPFFAALQVPIADYFYDQPDVWQVIGYEGPSAHLGGYINRGFDDIAWLPVVD